MVQFLKTDICVVGAGSGGLSVAAGAVQMGADVVLVEGGKWAGLPELWLRSIKALLAAAHTAHVPRARGLACRPGAGKFRTGHGSRSRRHYRYRAG